MTVTVANTLINNTWDFWRLRTNQMADVITNQAVTVGGNAAVGTAVIDGTLQVSNLYAKYLSGGTIAVPADLIIGTTCKMNIDAIVQRNLTVGANAYLTYAYVSQDLTANRIYVGNTVILGANVTTGNYFGTWSGNTIAINKGGTGITLTPGNGQVLVGNNGSYSLASIANTDGITVSSVAGSITVGNSGVLRFRANTTSPYRSGNVTLDSSDIVNALGFFPAVSNTDSWLRAGADLNYAQGNVAIGYTDAGVRSNGALMVRTTASGPQSVLRVENALNAAGGNAFVVTQVANTSASQGYRFMMPNGAVPAGMDYNNGSILFQTGTAYRFAFDASGSMAIGGTVPSPNKGGTGLHVFGTNAGLTLDNQTGTKWHIGVNPSPAFQGGTRRVGSFGIFSDETQSGIICDGSANNSFLNLFTNGIARVIVFPDGRVSIGGGTGGDNATLSVTGDINTTGSFTNYSDYRLKHDVNTLSDGAMERIMNLNPVTFRWNKNDQLEEGFLAHELQEVIPTAVQGCKDGVVSQVVDKSQLHPVIVKALQELINKVKEQQQQIDALNSR